MKYIFFTVRNFKREGGGTIRMYGVLNALAASGAEITLISNASDYGKFHKDINHINLNNEFSKKALFQGLLALVPAIFLYFIFSGFFKSVEKSFKDFDLANSKIIFFEYLDNSIAYVLKKKMQIPSYINDIHGISTIEFDYQRKNTSSILHKLIYGIKYVLSESLDRKVFEFADGLIYSSNAMQRYFESRYNLKSVKSVVLPNLLFEKICDITIDKDLQESIKNQHNIDEKDFILFFAGGYKPTSGLDDLIEVFALLSKDNKNLKLMLVGSGPMDNVIQGFINENGIADKVIQIKQIPYEQLITYQSVAHLIFCPDKYNEFSELIVHLKYFDSLVSGKPVINSAFSSVNEINKKDALSVSFIPSDRKSLLQKTFYCIYNYQTIVNKYRETREYACKHLTYKSHINELSKL